MTENNNNDDGWGSPDEDSTPRARKATKPPVAEPGNKMEFEMEGFDGNNGGNNRGK